MESVPESVMVTEPLRTWARKRTERARTPAHTPINESGWDSVMVTEPLRTWARKRTERAWTPAHTPINESGWDSTRERASTATTPERAASAAPAERASGSLSPSGVGHGDQTRGENQRGAKRDRGRLHRHFPAICLDVQSVLACTWRRQGPMKPDVPVSSLVFNPG
jgi:hypothetical protein